MIAAPQNGAGELHVLAETDEITAVCLQGEFDMANASQIIEEGERLLAADQQVIFDLSEATFIDCSVIHALARVGAEAKKSARVVVMQEGTSPIVERLIEITKIDRVLPRASTRPAALDTIRQLRQAEQPDRSPLRASQADRHVPTVNA